MSPASSLKPRLLELLSGARHRRVVSVELPVPFFLLAHVPRESGPIALLDRALTTSPYAKQAFAVVAPRFTLLAERLDPSSSHAVRMPWDDPLRAPMRVARARRTLSFDGETSVDEGCPFDLAEELLAAAKGSVPEAVDELAFACGFIGYFGYGAAAFLETLTPRETPPSRAPDLALLFADAVLSTSDAQGCLARLGVVGRGRTDEEASRDADAIVERVHSIVATARVALDRAHAHAASRPATPPRVVTAYSPETYGALVSRARGHVVRGDVFQLCLTHQVEVVPPPSPPELYEALRARNPAPFASFLRIGDVTVVSSSPERFLRLSADGVAEARPIKGTRRRGASLEEDEALAEELRTSEKDGAENDMIVDLLRNDLAKVSIPGSVEVRERRIVERHPTVLQLVSTIVSRLRPPHGPIDLLRAAFPGGSMTGAPKVRAVDLLAELEPNARGVYAGAIGYVDVRGSLDTSIAIRTFVFAGGRCSFGVGGGIVEGSEPLAEWHETLDKARALIDALAAVFGCDVVWELAPSVRGPDVAARGVSS